MDGPVFLPWDPRDLVPPGTPSRGLVGAEVGWEFLSAVFTSVLPEALNNLIDLLDL